MWKIDPHKDGIDHINVYSQGQTELGRWLSNFTFEPIITEDGAFDSIEGYWGWLSNPDERYGKLSGYPAKKLAKELPRIRTFTMDQFKKKIELAIIAKAIARPDMITKLKESKLSLKHYYVFDGKVKNAGYQWILDTWEGLRVEK